MLRYRSVAVILFENPEKALDSRMDRWMDKQCQDSSIPSAFWQETTKKFQIRLKEQRVLSTDRRQSKTLLTIDKLGSKITGNSVFDCHLLPVRQQMAI